MNPATNPAKHPAAGPAASTLREHATQYLAMRRNLGYKLRDHGLLLMSFIGYLEGNGHCTVTADAALTWAMAPADATRKYCSKRLSVARCFARYLSAFDPDCQVLPLSLLRPSASRPVPYLYSGQDIAALIHAAGTLRHPLHAATHQALIALLAATGLRLGEAVALDAGDVDLDAAVAVVRGKYDRTRLVPLHATTAAMLRAYRQRCQQLCPATATTAFFLSATGTRLSVSAVDAVFARLLVRAGITGRRGRTPKVHDLRHSYAVATLIDWYRTGADVAAKMPLLSAVMGHVGPASTFYYLHAAPGLLELAAQRLCNHQQHQRAPRKEEP
jgi:integrase/recombinase XerD